MNSRKYAVQVLQIVMVVLDPGSRLCHAVFWIASGHPLNTHEGYALAIQPKCPFFCFNASNAESRCEFVPDRCAAYPDSQGVQIRRVKMPELGFFNLVGRQRARDLFAWCDFNRDPMATLERA